MSSPYSRFLYEHEPLLDGQIRLIELSGASILGIKHVFLDDKPSYEALSYCWGSTKSTERIACGSQNFIEVTANLRAALSNLAQHDNSGKRLIWADAICINQRDVLEKNIQVSKMREIYRSALAVQIWVGEQQEDDDKAFDLLQRLLLLSNSENYSTQSHSISVIMPRARAKFLGLPGSWDDAFHIEAGIVALLKLVDRPWFQRIWIVQEVSVSQNAWLRCGKLVIEWGDFVRAIRCSIECRLRPLEGYGRELVLKIAHTRDTRRIFELDHSHSAKERNFWDCFSGFMILKQQIVWTWSMLFFDWPKTGLDEYQSVATNILINCGNLDIFGACHLSNNGEIDKRQSMGLPSWVPDWSSSGKHIPLRLQGTIREQHFHFAASGTLTSCVPKFRDPRTLTLKGILFDQIFECSLPALTRNPPPEETTAGVFVIMTDWFKEMYRMHILMRSIEKLFYFGSHKTQYVTGESIFEVYWQTLICGSYKPEGYSVLHTFFHDTTKTGNWRYCPPRLIPRNSAPGVWIYALAYVFGLLWSIVTFFIKLLWIWVTGHAMTDLRENSVVDTLISGRQEHMAYGLWRFVRTKKGYVGIVPSGARAGDWISVLAGGKVPLVLRRAVESGGWSLVGESYVHGIMQGEAFHEEDFIDIDMV